tara:strand:+ start:2536 stop:2883 length:348 start_codon:yes stop_codon:yes gene_type:complete
MSILTDERIEAIEAAIFPIEGAELYRGYSGRAMYGKTCFGIAFYTSNDYGYFMAMLACYDEDLAMELGAPRFDSLGLNVIAYWPNWDTADEDEDDGIGPMPDGGRSEPINGMYDV